MTEHPPDQQPDREPDREPVRIVRLDDLRGRGLVAWLILGPLAATLLVAAIAMRPGREASCNAALPCEEDMAAPESRP